MIGPYSDEYFMKQAFAEALKAKENDEVPVGAVIVANNTVIARAHNFTEHLCDVTAHAEMQAITAASNYLGGKYLDECVLYVTIEPCVMCAGALHWAQIERIVYGASDTKRGFSRVTPNILHPKTSIVKGVLEKDCEILLKNFFKDLRT